MPDPPEADDALGVAPASVRPLAPEAAARFRQLVEGQFDFIWRTLRGLGVPSAAADDAAQQVFWIAAQKLDAIAPGSERSFLFATARGVAANARRATARSREMYDDDALVAHADRAPNPEQAAASKEARAVLDRVLDELDEELRAVFVMFELEGVTTAQIAEILGIPMGTVASRLRRAREDFHAAAKRAQATMRGGARGGGRS